MAGEPLWNGGIGTVFELQLDLLGDGLAAQHGGKLQAEIDAGGAATAGHAIAIDHDALLHRNGAVTVPGAAD